MAVAVKRRLKVGVESMGGRGVKMAVDACMAGEIEWDISFFRTDGRGGGEMHTVSQMIKE